ncbi:mannosyltransferase [Kickxella alabastrina]|uniref:Mannosyltransferase n=1 Tax=Kickxella alabastrina TaxID=61397 RepID=A0ACC1IJD6_9FUNG|nr:mannosyltransferase [Kickxella alabastrina]
MDKQSNIRQRDRGRSMPDSVDDVKDATGRAKRVTILVLGDIGRSPRMQYHALSLARAGHLIDFVGYDGATPMEDILTAPNITLRHIRVLPQPTSAPRALFYIYAPLKVLYQLWTLFWMLLFVISRPDVILVQNPPAIPTLLVARVCAFLTGARLIIDWHNYGYTILGMKLGDSHPVVALAKRFEQFFGNSAYAHLCVTNAMASDLRDKWAIKGKLVVLHDKAPKHFKHLEAAEIHTLWTRLLNDSQFAGLGSLIASGSGSEDLKAQSAHVSLLTRKDSKGIAKMRKDRPMLLVSSTSWTADEDFSIILEALTIYEHAATSSMQSARALPSLVVLITGKGQLREFYEREISQMQLSKVHIVTAWLSAEDYPLLLGSADLGVSLHTSSSGLDLPMKVVDMLGCGTPVCAYRFSCINELVTKRNGMVFDNASELALQIQDLAQQLDDKSGSYQQLLGGAAEFRRIDWAANYTQALELF